jgi:hypothetical protein
VAYALPCRRGISCSDLGQPRLPSERQDGGPGTLRFAAGKPQSPQVHDDEPEDCQEVAIEPRDQTFNPDQLGWRFALGTVLIVAGYGAWSLIPIVIEADLEPSVKAALSGLFGATPFLTKVVAVRLMGRPAYNFLKRTVFQWLRRQWSGVAE